MKDPTRGSPLGQHGVARLAHVCGRAAGAVALQSIPNTLPQSGRMTLGVAVSPLILEGTTSRAATEISGAEHEGRCVSRHFRKQRAVPRRLWTHPEASWHTHASRRFDEGRVRNGAGVELTVDDTGPGIAPAVLPRLFTPFATTKATGTGLGLSICRRVLLEHGGTITAQNRAEGGARFTVVLPTAEPV